MYEGRRKGNKGMVSRVGDPLDLIRPGDWANRRRNGNLARAVSGARISHGSPSTAMCLDTKPKCLDTEHSV